MRLRRPAVPARPVLLMNAALGALLLAGAGWAYTLVAKPAEASATDRGGTRTVAVQQGAVTATVTASGSVASASTATAEFVTAGTVTAIRVHVGDKVKKGAVLATVDASAAQRQLDAAKANLTAARAALTRAQDAGTETADAQAQVTQAELDVEQAQGAVDGTTLTAPMSGTVVAINGTVGGASGGTSGGGNNAGGNSGGTGSSGGFIQIADLTKLEVNASVAEADATKLRLGQPATVTWNALPDAQVAGKLAAIDPNATTTNNVVQYGVTVSLDDRPDLSRPGQTVQVSITTGQVADAVYVPAAAVSTAGGRRTVIAATATGQQVRQVEVGLEGDQFTQIISGVEVGEEVVIQMNSSTGSGNPFRNGGGFPGGGPGGGVPGAVPGGQGQPGGGQRGGR
ncbi:efflux RND transporter periplasmic adaptor subunit [Rhizomonospora bruguierae]|uniref:efflux RND transporter periplasmic adaptor subunit n=1 Tax=Rhizomonospora bruguierae TaxID=1581705 RepID=UPI0020C1723E|nr:efflux RND transporter periplasmic adaptor subunit [Micromonospora sp. NBRC 107566]